MHDRAAIDHRLRTIFENQLNLRPEEINDRATLMDDLGCDSLDATELMMAVEEEFSTELGGKPIPDAASEAFKTYGDVLEFVVSGGTKTPVAES
jgi:acyl carrier protein